MTSDIATMLLARRGDGHLGLRTRARDWTWDEVVRESADRGGLALELRQPGPFHIGVLLDNTPDFVFWLGAAALAGAAIVGLNCSRGPATMLPLLAQVRDAVDCAVATQPVPLRAML